MASLYQIDQAILACVDAESGEVTDLDKLMELQMERGQKIENIALYIKNLRYEAEDIKAEAEALTQRLKAKQAKIDSLTAYLADTLNGERYETARAAISFRRSERVQIEEWALVPPEFTSTKTTVTTDKAKLKAAIKGGAKIDGCSIVTVLNPQIK